MSHTGRIKEIVQNLVLVGRSSFPEIIRCSSRAIDQKCGVCITFLSDTKTRELKAENDLRNAKKVLEVDKAENERFKVELGETRLAGRSITSAIVIHVCCPS